MTKVAVVMGSTSDWPTMQLATQQLTELGIAYDSKVISAHRMPDTLAKFGRSAGPRGTQSLLLVRVVPRIYRGCCCQHHVAGGGRAHQNTNIKRNGFVAVDCADAGWRPGRYDGNWRSGSHQCGPFCGSHPAVTDRQVAGRLEAFRTAQTQRATESEATIDE